MKAKLLLSTGLMAAGIATFHAQETAPTINTAPVKKIDVCEVYVSSGFAGNSNQNATTADYNKLAPTSELLKADLSGYSTQDQFGANMSGMFSVLMGMRFGNKDRTDYKPNPIFRIGFTYFNNTSLASNYYQSVTKRYDTLYSYQTGNEHFVDSVTTRNYNVAYQSQQIRLDASLIYRTDGKARWSFYAGGGLNVGVSLNAFTNVSYNNYGSIESDGVYYTQSSSAPNYYTFGGNNGMYSSAPSGDSQTETFKNDNNFAFSGYIPLGIDFRMGKKREFWKRTHLFCEFRPGISSTSIPELGTYNSAYWQTNFGIKINWEQL